MIYLCWPANRAWFRPAGRTYSGLWPNGQAIAGAAAQLHAAQQKGRRALRHRPFVATAGSR